MVEENLGGGGDKVTINVISWSAFLFAKITYMTLSAIQRTDPQLLAQFYYADEELNQVAAELDSLDGRKDPQRCTLLVNQFRSCQVIRCHLPDLTDAFVYVKCITWLFIVLISFLFSNPFKMNLS